jgi:hypothetical protein
MLYRLRQIETGREYYTEGKQRVTVLDGATPWQTFPLVDASEAQPILYQLKIRSGPNAGQAVEAVTPSDGQRLLLFNDRSAAGTVASWMSQVHARYVGEDHVTLNGGGDIISYPTTIYPDIYMLKCPEAQPQ